MNMHHFLMRRAAVILKQIIGAGTGRLHHGPADPRKNPTQCSSRFVREPIHRFRRLLWNHQSMSAAEGMNIQERQHFFILVNLVARDPPIDDFFENSFSHPPELPYPSGQEKTRS